MMPLYSFIFTNMEREGQEENAWGQVELNQRGRPKQVVVFYQLTEEMKQEALNQLAKDHTQVDEEAYQKFTDQGDKVWDKFYKFHKCNFFKDRTYLEREMPEITHFKRLHQLNGTISNYYELGCGVGNTLFPLLRQFECFNYYGCDISAKAIDLINEEMEKHPDLKPRMKVTVCDLVKHEIPYQLAGDLNSLIFVLSAIAPQRHAYVMQKVADSMKPGSFLFFRDYGRYDFGQLNLSSKGNRKLKDNFYRKNDGVCVYYFLEEELAQLATNSGLAIIKINFHCKLLQNRKTGLKMYRVWIQGRFYKPPLSPFFQECLNEQLQKEAMEEKQAQLQQKLQAEKVEAVSQKMQQQPKECIPKEQPQQLASKMQEEGQKQESSTS